MNYFFKLNAVSALYGFLFFTLLELQLNYYRIVRLTGWESKTIDTLLLVVHLIAFVTASLLLYKLTCKWLGCRRANYWTMLFWLPYAVLFLILFAIAFPITNQGDMPAPVQGLILLAQLISYPFCIGFLNLLYHVQNSDIVQI
ncbi:hypothetical protein ACQKII_19625 [Lysinibacillus sp. NPDC048646]|uniref:hypothetical protein n=1 Tax=Lysinibacillus sp. NPDC048646 TaxID=3390574 RepID=UPI003CFCDBF6